jgi:hypothetical protein
MRRELLLTVALTTLILPLKSTAQEVVIADSASEPAISALTDEIAQVASGGWWGTDDAGGWYRVVVMTGGFEHVSSRLFIQWISNPKDGDTPGPNPTTRQIELGFIWVLENPRLVQRGGTWHLIVNGQSNRVPHDARRQWAFRLGLPGHVIPETLPGG